jgi:N-acetylglutamate synthase-like GNAT family acetyltransferase
VTHRLTVRRATDSDVEPILDLLTHYDLPRSHFEPLYYEDPSYRPEQSLVAEADGVIVAHLRLFPRELRLGDAARPLPVLGVGNVVTAREWRERGHLRRFLGRVLGAAERRPYAFAVLWTYVPQVYARQGFETLTVPVTTAVVPAGYTPGAPVAVAVFRPEDLPEVEEFAGRYAAGLSGTTIRSHDYWLGQLRWLAEDPLGFLVARDGAGRLIGYVRSRHADGADGETEILELAVLGGDRDTARALLAAVSRRTGGALRGFLPAAQRELLGRPLRSEVVEAPGPMVRLLNASTLADALSGLLPQRLTAQGLSALDISVESVPGPGGASVHSAPGMRPLALRAEPVGVRVLDVRPVDEALHCTPASLARLMLGGAPPGAPGWLSELLPARDWVLWDADRV